MPDDDLPPLRRFAQRVAETDASLDPEERLEQAGMELVEHPVSPIDQVERYTIVDPRAGDAASLVEFPARFARPEGYPADWPFLSDHEATLTTLEAAEDVARILFWSEPPDLEAAVAAVSAEMVALGWHEHAPRAAPEAGAPVRHVKWFHRADRWRLLTESDAEPVGLALTDVDPERMWPGVLGRQSD